MYADEIASGNGKKKFFLDSSFQPEWYATITGDVVSVPNRLTKDIMNPDRLGLRVDDIQPGDEAIFKYLVVEDKEWHDDPDKFYQVSDDPRQLEYKNGNGYEVKIWGINKNNWAACYLDPSGAPIAGLQGKRKEVEKWAMQFPMLDNGEVSYKNLMIYDGVLYWKVDYSMLIGFIRNKKVHAGRGYVFVEPIEIDLGDKTAGGIVIPEYMRKEKSRRMGLARYIGEPREGRPKLSLNDGDFVVWKEGYGEQYEIGGLPWIVLKQEQIMGKLI